MLPVQATHYPRGVADVLLASDEEWVRAEVRSVLSTLPDATVREVTSGAAVLPAVRESPPDLAVLDLQIGNMGAIAVAMQLRLEESVGRLDHVPVLVLLDRRADVFMARRADVQGWVIKPLDPMRLRKAITTVLAGGTYYDESYRPMPVV